MVWMTRSRRSGPMEKCLKNGASENLRLKCWQLLRLSCQFDRLRCRRMRQPYVHLMTVYTRRFCFFETWDHENRHASISRHFGHISFQWYDGQLQFFPFPPPFCMPSAVTRAGPFLETRMDVMVHWRRCVQSYRRRQRHAERWLKISTGASYFRAFKNGTSFPDNPAQFLWRFDLRRDCSLSVLSAEDLCTPVSTHTLTLGFGA
ncbi:hypothetical protein R3P38DRAFT_1121395 [Favolaschia claudopus]|uniref:Uncharacterized protein n=1 Tax=Favolaschia claudopus TaxID=2862362 RepID=A0AAW0B9J3_9AGAR